MQTAPLDPPYCDQSGPKCSLAIDGRRVLVLPQGDELRVSQVVVAGCQSRSSLARSPFRRAAVASQIANLNDAAYIGLVEHAAMIGATAGLFDNDQFVLVKGSRQAIQLQVGRVTRY
jgi:hypothetical protein